MSRFFPPRLPMLAALAAGALIFPVTAARATGYNWINPNGGSWSNPANFSPNTPSAQGTTTGDYINFNGSGTATTIGTVGGNNSTGVETISLDADQAIGATSGTATSFFNTGGTTIVGNADPANATTRTLSFGAGFTVNTGVGAVTVGGNALALSLTGTVSTLTFTNNSTNALTFSAPISSAATPANPVAFAVAGTGNTTISGAFVSGTGTKNSVQLTKSGTGTLNLTAASTAVITFGITGGAVVLDGTQGGSLTDTAYTAGTTTATTFNMGAGSFTLLGNSNGTTSQTFNTTTFTGSGTGGSTILVDGGTANAATTLNLGASVAANAGSSGNLTVARGGIISVTGANSNGLIGAGHVIYNGTDFASKVTNGTSGTLAGNIGAATTTALPATGGSSTTNYLATDSLTQTGALTINSLKLTNTQTGQSFAQAGNSLAVTTGGILFTGPNAYSIDNGTLTVNSASAATDLVIHQYGAGALTVSSAVVNSAGTNAITSLTKAGPGVLQLTGASTYTGLTYVNGGTLVSGANGINSAAGGMYITNPGTVFAPAAGTVLTPGQTTGGTAIANTAALITMNNGSTLAPGGVGTIGMLTLNGASTTARILSVGVGSHFAFDLGANNTSDNITFLNYAPGTGVTTNDFAINASRLTSAANGTQATVVLDITGARAGTYTLFSFFSDNGTTAVTSNLNASYFDLADSTGLNGYNASLAFNVGSVTLTLTAVPEPSTWALCSLAAAGFLVWRRARRRTGNATA